ncbi:MAG: 16S rRNA (cytosine(1402)-N(4))-methyltransferase RsmH [Parvularculaceae bacterium]|nr:MAG: 16S rRNA (cytosine(1402)-N(4))-methyltransferase RsmH [Parvularculaceae bacterium]
MTAAQFNPDSHKPVMLQEVLAALGPCDGDVYVDGTLGAGGYARGILDAAQCRLFGFDRDAHAHARAAEWSVPYKQRFEGVHAPFGDLQEALTARNIPEINGAVFDLGVSSMQLDEGARGFSFRTDGPLSMRMDSGRPDARDVINSADAAHLAAIFKAYGEERHAKRIARAIVEARDAAPIETTIGLAGVIEAAQPAGPPQRIHPATRVFQALRIFVNDELGQLVRALAACERLLSAGGRLVVVTFHSLEDRIVKNFFRNRMEPDAGGSRHAPPVTAIAASFQLSDYKSVPPSEAECAANPRARSARLRCGVRTGAPAIEGEISYYPPNVPALESFWRSA